MDKMEKFNSRTIRAGNVWVDLLAITDNPSPDLVKVVAKEFSRLAEVAAGFQDLCNKQGETIDLLEYKNKILREQVDSLLKEVQILEERNHNQAIMLSRKDRK